METYELTSAQLSIYQMEEFAKEAIACISSSIIFNKDVNVEKIKNALNIIVKKNDALRMCILRAEQKQYVKQYNVFNIDTLKFSNIDEFTNWANNYAKIPIDIEDCLFDFKVIIVDGNKGVFIKLHHIISDAWSVAKIYSLIDLYCKGNIYDKDDIKFPSYINYVKKNQEYYKSKRFQRDLDFWKDNLEECSESITLSLRNSKNLKSKRIVKRIDKELTYKIKEFCNANSVSEYCLFLTVLGIYIKNVSGKEKFYIGTTFLNRDSKTEKETLGMFVLSQALSMKVEDGSFFENVIRCKNNILTAMKHQKFSYMDVLEQIENVKLYDITLNYQNALISNINDNYDVSWYHCNSQTESLDIHIYEDVDETLKIHYDFQDEKFNEWEIEYHHTHILEMLCKAIEDKNISIKSMKYLSQEEQQQLKSFNETTTEYDKTETIVSKFEKQVKDTPDNIAVVYENESVTYDELNKKANILARKLRKIGIKKDDFVVIIADRSIEMIIAIYGVIKAGGAYVPIDPTYPLDRRQYIIEDSNPKAIITYKAEVFNTDRILIDLQENFIEDDSNLEIVNTSRDLAYCIYTSGTTGKPKGVIIEHRSLINMVYAYKDIYKITDKDVVLQFASFSFDQSVWDIFNITLFGGTLCMLKTGLYSNIEKFTEYVNDKKVTIAALTPAYISECDPNEFKTLRVLESGGEQAKEDVLKQWYGTREIFNTYGPTEVTVNAITYKCEKNYDQKVYPIGKPINNLKVFMINDFGVCGIGVPGELCICGDGLARGYLNKPELTAEKFVENDPYIGERVYHTGDLARWLPDGNIEYLGRIDKQVKIRGFRIELGEIENVIRKTKYVKDAIVIAKKDKTEELSLYAYIVSEKELDMMLLRKEIACELPAYMLPAYMAQIEKIPINKNGKLDEKALPIIETKSVREYIEPINEIERQICNIFEQVLKITKIGRDDNFFEMGGHSLKVTKVINKIEKNFGVHILIKDIFDNPTPEKIALLIQKVDNKKECLIKAEKKEFYDMSSSQNRLYVLSNIDDGGTSYNMPVILKSYEKLDGEKLQYALNELIKRYESLRTHFIYINGKSYQVIEESIKQEVEIVNIKEAEKEKVFMDFIKPFDLAKAPLIRVKWIVTEKENFIIMDMHHIISDGISLEIYINDFIALYKGEELEKVEYQYKDYSEWINKQKFADQEEYWLNMFQDDIPIIDIPLDYNRPKIKSFKGSNEKCFIDKKLKDKIIALSKETGTTQYMVLLAGVMIFLSKYSRQEDIVIGSPVSGRSGNDFEKIAGMFVNTSVLRAKPEKDKMFKDFLYEIKEVCIGAFENQDYPFENLVEKVCKVRDLSRNPMFDVMFAYEEDFDKIDGFEIKEVANSLGISKFDLTITVKDIKDGFEIDYEYCTDLFKKETIVNMSNHLKNILFDICNYTNKKISDINLVDEEEKKKITNEFNNTYRNYNKEKNVIEIFEEQVEKNSSKIAVIFEDEKISYRQLNNKANHIAKKLREYGVKPNDFVSIIAKKSSDMIAGILGIIKSGAGYVPISISYPKDRIEYILKDSGSKVVVTYGVEDFISEEYIELKIDEIGNEQVDNVKNVNKPDDLVYAIYTSGTTGKPKGVMIEHKNLVNLIYSYEDIYSMSCNDVILQFANISFDQSVLEIFLGMMLGATLCVVSENMIGDMEIFENYIIKNEVTWIGLTPAYMKEVDFEKFTKLRLIESGGSAAEYDILNMWSKKVKVFNTYGPTETTVNATSYDVSLLKEDMKSIPIGKPMYNTKVYIMDGYNICGIGVPGELCITGKGVARGYINRDDLNEIKFVNNSIDNQKMYRSGDLARWLSDGNIEYLGRIDEQVKIRGYRIELGEIENVIRRLDDIEDVAVVINQDKVNDNIICAYVVSKQEINIDTIKKELEKDLPDYMIPTYIKQINKIPITTNGKLDKKKLPVIEISNNKNFIAPTNDIEKNIANIFKDVLGVDAIGIKDSFFELGGDSIKAIRAVSKLREIGYITTIKNIMNYRNIENIAKKIGFENNIKNSQKIIVGEATMLPIQMEFFENKFENENHYNQAILFSADELDLKFVEETLEKILLKHDILRAVYKDNKQIILSAEECNFKVGYKDFVGMNYKHLIKEDNKKIQMSMDIHKGCLFKSSVYKTDNKYYLFICAHHLIIDGVSWRIIADDFEEYYRELCEGKQIKIKHKTSSYSEWGETLKEFAKKTSQNGEKEYWLGVYDEVVNDDIELLSNTKNIESYEGIRCGLQNIVIDEDITKNLIFKSSKAYNTEINDLLLAALINAVNKWNKMQKICIELESHGRVEIDENINLEKTVGWFTTLYPIILKKYEKLEEQIINTKEMLRKIKFSGIGYKALYYYGEHTMRKIKPEIIFNYLGNNDIDSKNGTLKLERYSSEDDVSEKNHLENGISINSFVIEDKMNVEINYDKKKYTNDEIADFAKLYVCAIEELVDYCTNQDKETKTISDLGEFDLEESEVNEFLDFLDNL